MKLDYTPSEWEKLSEQDKEAVKREIQKDFVLAMLKMFVLHSAVYLGIWATARIIRKSLEGSEK